MQAQGLPDRAQGFVASRLFQSAVIAAIVLSAIILGLETNPTIMEQYGAILKSLDRVIIGFFVVEIALKILALGKRPLAYFKDSWNVIDFAIVVSCLVPSGSNVMAIFRLVRVLRVLRLITALPKLQTIVTALLKSVPSMGYVVLLLGINFYIFGVLGTFLFGANDPLHFGSLGRTCLSLFQTLTLEGWADLMRIQLYGCANFGYEDFPNQCVASNPQPVAAVLYFVSFIVVGTMIMLNLLIGVVVNGMAESAKELEESAGAVDTAQVVLELREDIRALREELKQDKRRSRQGT